MSKIISLRVGVKVLQMTFLTWSQGAALIAQSEDEEKKGTQRRVIGYSPGGEVRRVYPGNPVHHHTGSES
jgi:hypothetical protein